MATTKKLLTTAQVTQCKQIADTDALYGKRADALLKIHAGQTHVKAAEETGLTLSQLKYWLKKFREVGMKAFPDTSTTTNDTTKTAVANKPKADTDKPAKKVKDKKEKRKKKEKKDKKDKQSKKSKKKAKAKKKSKK